MRELSLFSGAGGGLLASKILGWRPVGYVEKDEFCQRVIAQRILDGWLPAAPIFGDIRDFLHEGYATEYRGLVDIVTGGVPCQPWSCAGKRQGEVDDRNLWPATIDVLRAVRPRLAFLENVSGFLANAYAKEVLSQITKIGFDARWSCLSAASVGAHHQRTRVWIVAVLRAGAAREHTGEEIEDTHSDGD